MAWPTAEIAVMGPEGAVNIVSRREISKSKNPEVKRDELVREYRTKFANPYVAAGQGYIDDVIDPAETKVKLSTNLKMLQTKIDSIPPKKHGNIPL